MFKMFQSPREKYKLIKIKNFTNLTKICKNWMEK